MYSIRLAKESDRDSIWQIFHEVVQEGDTYTYPQDIEKEEALSSWLNEGNTVYVAENGSSIDGTYNFHANFPGSGSHIANASYMVSKRARGKGLGEAMANHSIEKARESGFLAMQFNLVVSSNVPAIRLWKKVGFDIVGTIPEAFKHPLRGYVDAYIMYRKL